MGSSEKKSVMHDLMAGGIPIGVPAYDKDVPAAFTAKACGGTFIGQRVDCFWRGEG